MYQVYLGCTVVALTLTAYSLSASPVLHSEYSLPRPPARAVPATPGAPYDVVVTSFFADKSFYVHSKISPDVQLRGAYIFLLSLFRHRRSSDGVSTRVVVFCDTQTEKTIREGVARFGAKLGMDLSHAADAAEQAFFPFVIYETPNATALYPGKRWANSKELANAANFYRFPLYEDWLAANRVNVNRVMVSDLTDVAFQANPFDGCDVPAPAPPRGHLTFTLEFANYYAEVHNIRWMRCHSKEIRKRLRRKRAAVSCSGVTFGDATGVLAYLASMRTGIDEVTDCAIYKLHSANDQAIHNYILHITGPDGLGTDVAAHRHGTRCAYHGNFGGPVNFENGAFVNGTHVPFAIVHQYGRCRRPTVQAFLEKEYGVGPPGSEAELSLCPPESAVTNSNILKKKNR